MAAAAASPVFRRTLRLAVSVATQLEFPELHCFGGHTVGEGYYYELEGKSLSEKDISSISKRIQDIVESNAAIVPVKKPWKEAHAYFEKHRQLYAKALIESRVEAHVDCVECQGVLRLAVFPFAESMGILSDRVAVEAKAPGLVAAYSSKPGEANGEPAAKRQKTVRYLPQPALQESHSDHKVFSAAHSVLSVGALNKLRQVGRQRKDYVLACEFRQEGKLGSIARAVLDRKAAGKAVKIICVAGPTSSGKTTFATKLCIYLENVGFVAKALTVDHYYLPLDRQPKYQIRKQRIDVDYDHIESMDVDLVGEHLNAIVRGESIVTPKYNMKTGYRDEPGHTFDALPSNGILVIEGIHALNPLYTKAVDPDKVFKIFISPLTALQLDDFNAVKTTDHRLLRRMCRDYLFRGNSASTTLKMWDNVRKGEGVWIFPHQNDADFVMNSAAEYEIPVLKTFVEPLLRAVDPDDPNFDKAQQVLRLLDCFGTWPPDLAPPAALLREFIGDGAFDCH